MPEKCYIFLEILFFIILCLPYAFILFGGTHNGHQFAFFSLGLATLLPLGAIILFLEHILVKPKANLKPVIIVFSVIDIVAGVYGWMMFLLIAVS
jgi:hypothetical protein